MKKIEKKLIELLGGIRPEEYHREDYGTPADEWCKHMYSFIKNQYEIYMDLVEKRKEKILQ